MAVPPSLRSASCSSTLRGCDNPARRTASRAADKSGDTIAGAADTSVEPGEFDRAGHPVGLDLYPRTVRQGLVEGVELGVQLGFKGAGERSGFAWQPQLLVVLVALVLEVGGQVVVRVAPGVRADDPDFLAAHAFA